MDCILCVNIGADRRLKQFAIVTLANEIVCNELAKKMASSKRAAYSLAWYDEGVDRLTDHFQTNPRTKEQ